jgi:fibronectin-binding autotransporter adhesin
MKKGTRLGLSAALAALALAGAGRADSYVWTQTNRGVFNWSDPASWSNNAAPPSGGGSNVTVQLFTNKAVTVGYAQTNINDVADPLTLNALKVRTTGANANNTVLGGALKFMADGATQPLVTIDVNGGTFRIRNDLVLGNAPLRFSFPQGNNTGNIYLDGAISGTGNVVFADNGLYTYLTGNKTFVGDVVTSNRQVTLGGTNLWTGNVTVRNGAALYLSALGANNNYNGSTTIDPGGILEVNSASGTWTNDVENNGTLSYYNGGSPIYTFSNRITGSGDVRSTGNAATLLLAGTNNTYTGKTSIQYALQVNSIGNLGEPSSIGAPTTTANGTINVTSMGTLKYLGAGNASDRAINMLSWLTLDSSGTGPLIMNGALVITNAGNRTLILQGAYTNAENVLAGHVVNTTLATATNYTALTKTGDGTWLLTGNNTYTGVTDITGGRLRIASAASLSPGNIFIRADNSPKVGVLETGFDLIRDGGTTTNQMRIDQVAAGSAFNGFSARGAPITVQFGVASPSNLTWGVMPLNVQGSLLLNHLTADSKLTFPNPISLGNSAAAYRNIGVFANVAEMSGALTQGAAGANLRKFGAGELILSANNTLSNLLISAGTLTLTGTNTFRDATVSVGALNVSGSNAFGSVTVGAGTALTLSGVNAFSNLTSSGTVTLSDTNTFNNATVNAGTLTLNGSNTYNNVTLNGGTLQLGGAKVASGTTTLAGGTLVLDYTVENNDKLDPTKSLKLGSGAVLTDAQFHPGTPAPLVIVGHPSAPFTQVVNGLTLAGRENPITMSGVTALSLGAITRDRGVGTLVISSVGSGAIMTTSGMPGVILTNSYGVAYATVNGDWAAKDPGNVNIVDGASLGGFYTSDTWAPLNNTDITTSGSPGSGKTTHSLRFNTAGANTITLAGANTITSGGILVTPNVGANLTRITGGTLSQPTGGNNGEIMVIQNNTNGDLQIDSVIANTSGRMSLNKNGPGKLILTANSTATGYIYLNAGTVQFGDGIVTGTFPMWGATGSGVFSGDGAVIRVMPGLTVAFPMGLAGWSTATYTVDMVSNSYMSVSGQTGANWIKKGTGTLQLNGAGYMNGWVKEGTFIVNVSGTTYSINGGATIGDTAPGALPATVFLLSAVRVDQFGTATTYINRTGILDFNTNSINLGSSPTFVGGGSVTSTHASPGTATLQGNVTYNAANSSDAGATIGVVPLSLGAAARTFTINDSAYVDTEMTIGSDISGNWGLTKAGAGTMAFSGNNAYTGVTTVSAGMLLVKKPASLPNYNVNGKIAVSANATLAVCAGGAGEWTAADIDTLRAVSPSHFAANSWLGIDTTAGEFTYGSVIGNGAGALNFRKLGTSRLVLAAANTFTGNTVVHAGTLVASNANALGTSGTITVNSNSTFAVGAGITFSRPVTFNPGSALAGQGTFYANAAWSCPVGFTVAPGLPAGTLTVDRSLALSAGNTLSIAFQPDGSYGELAVNGTLDISEPTARLVLTGKAPTGKTVLAEGTARVGEFLDENVDLTGLTGTARISYTATQVVLNVDATGTLIWIR